MHTSMCSANEWHHVVGTYDSGTAKIYIDGILEATEAGQNAMAENNDPLQIGRRGTGDYFSGIIDEVAIYDGALTSDEILGHYYAGLAGHGYCECPDTVYVDDEYTSSSCGGHNWHWDAFATIQEGVDAVCEGGTVYVNGGTYIEQIYITKSLMLEGISSTPKPVIQAPLAASRLTYTIPESGRTFDPIVFADGGTTGISITVDNFEIDGLNDGGSNTFCGILVRNASGAISNSDLHGLKGTGQETMGILMYGTNTDITVSDNTVMDFSRNGITINCGGQADIEGNTVTGDGPLPAGYWAQNGIQAGWGAGGSIIGNTVTGCSYTGSGWAASGILPTASSGTIEIYGNTLQENQVNIYLCECSADIDGNDIYATATGTSQTYFYGIIGDPGSPPNIPKPSPFDEESDGSFATTTYTITCTGNTVESDGSPGGVGIGIYAGMYGTYDIDFTATYNTVRYWEVGFELYEYVPNNLISAEIHYNNIEGNTGYGILNWLSKIYNAECNWWGHCSGPTHSSNPLGCGDDVSDYVDYLPWLDASYPSGNCIGGLCQNTVYVDDDYDCSTPGWNIDHFANIQDGIDRVCDGGTVNVEPGLYEEIIYIDFPVTILGATNGVCKNGYAVPPNYDWDDTTQSIIQPPTGHEDDLLIKIYDTDDVTFDGFIVQALERGSSGNRMLMHVEAQTQTMENINIINNIIGPNTNLLSQDGNKGRMNLDLDLNPYDETIGITDSSISCNKIFDSLGNGDNIFIWGSYHAYGATGPSPMTNTVIEDNEICGAHRCGIETAGGHTGLTIRNNNIHSNSGNPGDTPVLKYGSGILLIRGSSDKVDCNGYGPFNLLIENNNIYNNEKHGIYMGPKNQDVTIQNNYIYNNGLDGVQVDLIGNYWNPDYEPGPGPHTCLDGSSNVEVHYNDIENNLGFGAQVIGTPTNGFILDATCNWWGYDSGPTHPSNPMGVGDTVSDEVDFLPWLNLPFDDPDTICGGGTCQDEVWVDDNYHSGTPGWFIDHFYHMQDAMYVISANGIVHVMDGTYQEDIVVDVDSPYCIGRSNLLIQGEDLPVDDNTRALIDGTIEINTDLTILEYFWFMPTTDAAVTVNGNDVTISNNVFDHGCDPDSIGVYATEPVNAECNWWGAPNGPNGGLMNDGTTADGYGVQVIGSVDVEPWIGVHAEAVASSYSVETGEAVIFDAEGSWAADFDGTYEPIYYWAFGDGFYYGNMRQTSHVYDTPGTYEVYVRVRGDGIGGLHSNFMYDWAYLTITVTSPGAPLSANADGGNLGGYETIVGEPVQLSGFGSGGTPPYSYSWSLGDGRTSSEQNPTVVYENENTYTVTLTVTDSMGTTASDTAQVSVYGIDELVVNAGGPYNGVVDTPVYFSGSVIGGVEPYNYSWDLGDGTISDLANPTYTYEGEGAYAVTLTVTDDQGTIDTDTTVITVEEQEEEAVIGEIWGGFGVKTTIDAGDSPVSWSIEVNGRIFLGGYASGSITAHATETVKLPFSLGIGRVDITVTANDVVEERSAFMLGPFVLSVKEV